MSKSLRLRRLKFCLLIFFIALGVRFLIWQDNHLEVWRVQTSVTSGYKDSARQLLRGELSNFFTDHMEHPPGYPILLAGIFKAFGDSDTAIQFVQMISDSAAAVFVFLIALELFPLLAAIIAGLLAALSPQFAYHSVLLLPDSLAVLPILLAVYLIVRAIKHPRLVTLAMAGVFIGLSCWLRANALLLAPVAAAAVPLLFERGKRLRFSAALTLGALVAIAPITIKNLIVFHRFIPVSLGAGQTLLEGIAECDTEGRFNIPSTDWGIMKQEAEWYHRPDYALVLFGPDGIERERRRLARGFAVIRSHPAWYLGVMSQRAVSSLRLDRVPIISPESPISHAAGSANGMRPIWSNSAAELMANGVVSTQTDVLVLDDGQHLRITGDNTKYGDQIVSAPIAIEKSSDYVLRLPLKLLEGRTIIKVTDLNQGRILGSIGVDVLEGVSAQEQPWTTLSIPFVSGNISQVRLVVANNAPGPVRPVLELGQAELFDLGASSLLLMRYPRLVFRYLQKPFITAFMLPCVIASIVLLVRERRIRSITVLLIVPLYYLSIQSALHTERRYVIAIQYFLVMFAATSLAWLFTKLNRSQTVTQRKASTRTE